ncbi:hypothetical protein C8F04DRAFT_673521 [Mycena alexandri]|uniref:Uncharacterized protein n=1 Tax=Mycena alexandri TaxID=1745969 RepID=A0AAD6SRF8_9AGAR|nr:hypothetical protein C8F04DRAFT_673521 [Mycena alexandri]
MSAPFVLRERQARVHIVGSSIAAGAWPRTFHRRPLAMLRLCPPAARRLKACSRAYGEFPHAFKSACAPARPYLDGHYMSWSSSCVAGDGGRGRWRKGDGGWGKPNGLIVPHPEGMVSVRAAGVHTRLRRNQWMRRSALLCACGATQPMRMRNAGTGRARDGMGSRGTERRDTGRLLVVSFQAPAFGGDLFSYFSAVRSLEVRATSSAFTAVPSRSCER